MHILVLAQYFPPDMGGGATRAQNVVRGLIKAGCRVTVVSAVPHYPFGEIPKEYRWRPIALEYEGRTRIFRTFVPPLASSGFVKRVILFASFVCSSLFALPFVGRVDVVFASNPNVISFYPGLVYALIKHCRLVQNVDDLWPEALYDLGMSDKRLLAKAGELMAKFAYRVSSAIVPISPAYVGVITTKYGVNPGKVHVVPAGVDTKRFPAKTEKKRRKFKVLYIGAFSPAYDFDQVLKAASLLANHSDLEIVIQGGGELAGELRDKVKRLALNNVSLVEKIVSRDEVAEILAEADVLLLPLCGIGSIEMGISSKLYEYQAAGKPIVCCSKGEPARYVSETNSGIVVKPGDHEVLAQSILYLMKNRVIAEKLGESGRWFVEKNLSIEKIGLQMKKLFESIT